MNIYPPDPDGHFCFKNIHVSLQFIIFNAILFVYLFVCLFVGVFVGVLVGLFVYHGRPVQAH